jgi:hypothetical protein
VRHDLAGEISPVVGEGACVLGVAIVAAVLSVTSFWYGGIAFVAAVVWARYGILNVPALVIGAMELWVGGLLGLAAGTLVREPPALPDRQSIAGWSVVMFVAVMAVMLMRRPEVEAELPASVRRAMDGRFIALGAVAAAVVLFVFGYL